MKENEPYENNNNFDQNKNLSDINLDLDFNMDKYKSEIDSPIEKDLENFKKIKKIEKIVCPQCGEMPSLKIDTKNYIITSYCPNKHSIKDKLVNYIKNSNNKLNELSEPITCSSCEKTNVQLKIDIKDMYQCNCKKVFCEECKENHEEEENNEITHNLIKYSEIDFQCQCSGEFSDYNSYCVNCNKNLCLNCQIEHQSEYQHHEIILFSDEIEKFLTKEEIKNKKDELAKQENSINNFLKNIDDWKKLLDAKIEHLKENLKLLRDVNKYLLEGFDISFINQQIIECIKRLNFSYNILIDQFNNNNINNINDTNNIIINDEKEKINFENIKFEDRYKFLFSLFEYQKKLSFTIEEQSNNNKNNKNIQHLNIIKNKTQIETKIESKITSICQFDEGIAVGDDKGFVHLFKLNNKLVKILTISDDSGKEINYLYYLKNKYFIYSNENEIKIIKINKTKDRIQNNIIKSFKYNSENENNNNNINEKYYQIIELINCNIIYINEDKLMRIEPLLNNNFNQQKIYEKENVKIISINEINENIFCIYSENNEIIIMDSNDFSKKSENIKINIQNDIFKKIETINNGLLAGLGNTKIYIISFYKKNNNIIKIIDTQINNIDMIIMIKPHKILIAGLHNFNYYIKQYNYDFTKDNVSAPKNDTIKSETIINKIFLYQKQNENYGNLIYIHNNNCIKIYTNNNNNN